MTGRVPLHGFKSKYKLTVVSQTERKGSSIKSRQAKHQGEMWALRGKSGERAAEAEVLSLQHQQHSCTLMKRFALCIMLVVSGSASHAGSAEQQRHLPGIALAPARLPAAMRGRSRGCSGEGPAGCSYPSSRYVRS